MRVLSLPSGISGLFEFSLQRSFRLLYLGCPRLPWGGGAQGWVEFKYGVQHVRPHLQPPALQPLVSQRPAHWQFILGQPELLRHPNQEGHLRETRCPLQSCPQWTPKVSWLRKKGSESLFLGRRKRDQRDSEEKSYEVSGSRVTIEVHHLWNFPLASEGEWSPLVQSTQVDKADKDGLGPSK